LNGNITKKRFVWYKKWHHDIRRFNMLEIHKSMVVDENHKPIAVQIPIE